MSHEEPTSYPWSKCYRSKLVNSWGAAVVGAKEVKQGSFKKKTKNKQTQSLWLSRFWYMWLGESRAWEGVMSELVSWQTLSLILSTSFNRSYPVVSGSLLSLSGNASFKTKYVLIVIITRLLIEHMTGISQSCLSYI